MTEVLSIGAIVGCYAAIFAMYRWSDNQMDRQRENLEHHVVDAAKHALSSELVFRDVCGERVKRMEQGQQAIVNEMRAGFKDVKEAIKNGPG